MLGNDEFLVVELLEVRAYAFALEDLLKEIAYEFFEGLDVLFGAFFGGDRERDEDDDELLPDKDADERLLRLTGDLLLLCLGGGGIRLGGVLLRGDGRLLGLGRLLGEYDLDRDLWRLLGRV